MKVVIVLPLLLASFSCADMAPSTASTASIGRTFSSRIRHTTPTTIAAFKRTPLHLTQTQESILSLRGGAGPIDPNIAAKSFSWVLAVQCLFNFLAGDVGKELWQFPSDNGWDNTMYLEITGSCAAYTVIAFSQLFLGMDHQHAVGWSTVPYAAQLVHKLITGKAVKAGVPVSKQLFLLVVQMIVSYSCLTGTEWAGTAMKLYGFHSLLNAIFLTLSPKNSAKFWGLKCDSDVAENLMLRCMGMNLLQHALMVLTPILYNSSVNESIGYGALGFSVALASLLFVTKDVDKAGAAKEPMLAYLVFQFLIALSILF